MNANRVELQVMRYEAAASPRLGGQRKCRLYFDNELVMMKQQSVVVDDCTKCRVVWLDRGGLDKIVELSVVKLDPISMETTPNTARQS
jgi:Zn-finger nucleic acid-binding protein